MDRLLECPKHMDFGPCGGVEFDGSCEVSPARCVFLDQPTVRWTGPGLAAPDESPMRARLREGRVVVADFPARALDAASIAECGGILAGTVDAVLAGDAGNARVQFSPAYRASLIRASGVDVGTGLNC